MFINCYCYYFNFSIPRQRAAGHTNGPEITICMSPAASSGASAPQMANIFHFWFIFSIFLFFLIFPISPIPALAGGWPPRRRMDAAGGPLFLIFGLFF